MRSIAFCNQKGGTGKTTSLVNLAAALGERGLRVLAIDLDPQANASSWLGVNDGGRGLLDVLTEEAPLADFVVPSSAPGVDLVPASAWLIGAEKAVSQDVGAEAILRNALGALPNGRWDYVFIDCQPSLGILTINALAAVDQVLVPVEVSSMALGGLAALVQTIERVRRRLNPDLAFAGILVCRANLRTLLTKDVVERLRERFGAVVFDTVIRESIRLKEAPSFGQPITIYAPESSGSHEYRAVAAELLSRAGEAEHV